MEYTIMYVVYLHICVHVHVHDRWHKYTCICIHVEWHVELHVWVKPDSIHCLSL